MGFRLRLYDEGGSEIGWMTAARTDHAPDVEYRSPWTYEWEITHPEPEQWGGVEAVLRHSEKPYIREKAIEDAIENEGFTYAPDRTRRIDEDGPEAYLEEVAHFAKQRGTASTEIIEE